MKYRTIVVDPPWRYGRNWNGFSSGKDSLSGGTRQTDTRPLPYDTLSLTAIRSLCVGDLASSEAHLYLWVPQRFLWDAPSVIDAWGFTGGIVLTWCKTPMGGGLGDAFSPTTEFVVFAHRGGLRPLARHHSTWFAGRRGRHSAKPAAFLDIVEKISPEPRLEMFARRQRLGWDTWGNEALNHVEIA